LLENILLAPYTTLGVGGPARWFVETADEREMLAAVEFARAQDMPWFVLGGGSNLLVADDGFPGVVLRVSSAEAPTFEEAGGVAQLTASAGVEWDGIVSLAVAKNYSGIECLAGIPGSVGGTPVQNVGAYGQEVSRSIVSVRALDLEAGKAVELPAADCGFEYRRSIFNSSQRGRYAITRVVYALQLDGKPHIEYRDVKQFFAERGIAQLSLVETADAVRTIRRGKGMLLAEGDPDSRSAGSFFKNPVVVAERLPSIAAIAGCAAAEVPQFPAGGGSETVKLSAAWLIERSGFHKGFALGRAGLSSKHVLAIVNRGGSTAAEIVALRDLVLHEVERRFAIRLEQEPVELGAVNKS